MKKRILFSIAGVLAALCILSGGVYKRTCLTDYRSEYRYGYTMEYLFVMEDVPDYVSKVLCPGVPLFCGNNAYAGDVTAIHHGGEDGRDLTLHITAYGISPHSFPTGTFQLTGNNRITLYAPTIQLEGHISQVTR